MRPIHLSAREIHEFNIYINEAKQFYVEASRVPQKEECYDSLRSLESFGQSESWFEGLNKRKGNNGKV